MSDALTNAFSGQVVLEDKSRYDYTARPFEMTNALENVIAVLQEYIITGEDDGCKLASCKLYKTRDGNWYELDEPGSPAEPGVIRALKLAIDTEQRSAAEQNASQKKRAL